MSKIAYVPFNDAGLLAYVTQTVGTFNSGRLWDKFDPAIRVNGDTLSDVRASQQVYVFGHGSVQADALSDNAGNRVDMPTLARQLKAAGLAMGLKKLKLFSCSGGVGGGQSTALKLLVALNGEGYAGLKVYGYTESLQVDAVDGMKRGSSGTRAQDVRVGFQRVGTGGFRHV